jgi:hypothetical protein
MTICLSWQFIKILGLLIIEFHNISPFERRCFQPLKNMFCVTKFMLGTIIPILMCMKNALLFSNNQFFHHSISKKLNEIHPCKGWSDRSIENSLSSKFQPARKV